MTRILVTVVVGDRGIVRSGARFIKASSGVDGSSKAGKAIPVEGVPHPLSPPVTLHQARLAQNLQVMGDCRLALAERTDEVADTDLALRRGRQDAEDPEPDWIG